MQEMTIRAVGKQDQRQASPGHMMIELYIKQRGLHTEAGTETGQNLLKSKCNSDGHVSLKHKST